MKRMNTVIAAIDEEGRYVCQTVQKYMQNGISIFNKKHTWSVRLYTVGVHGEATTPVKTCR